MTILDLWLMHIVVDTIKELEKLSLKLEEGSESLDVLHNMYSHCERMMELIATEAELKKLVDNAGTGCY